MIGASSVQGTVTGTQVQFQNVQIPSGATNFTVTNVRVNAAGLSAGTTVTESVLLVNQGLVVGPAQPINLPVTLVLPGLAAGVGGIQTFPACSAMTLASGPAFQVPFGENFSSAFKTRGIRRTARSVPNSP